MRIWGAWAVLGMLSAFGGAARAEGPGIRLGDQLVLHPGLASEFVYDTNIFYSSNNLTPAFSFRLIPTIDLATRSMQRSGGAAHLLDFRLHAGLEYNEFITNQPGVSEHRWFSVTAGAQATIKPGGRFETTFYDNYTRSSQLPYGNSLGNINIDEDRNQIGGRFTYRPGGGRLELSAAYSFTIDLYEFSEFEAYNNQSHNVELRGSWKFLPKTALFVQATEAPTLYFNKSVNFVHQDSYPLRIEAGLQGLLTTKLSFQAYVGYGNGFYQPPPATTQTLTAAETATLSNPNGPLGGIDIQWRPWALSAGSIGYKHDFGDSVLGAYDNYDTVYVGWTQLIWRFSASLRVTYQNIRYKNIPASQSICNTDPGVTTANGGCNDAATVAPFTSRTDNFVSLDAHVDYPFKDYLILTAGYLFSDLQTDSALSSGILGIFPIPYMKHQILLKLSFLY